MSFSQRSSVLRANAQKQNSWQIFLPVGIASRGGGEDDVRAYVVYEPDDARGSRHDASARSSHMARRLSRRVNRGGGILRGGRGVLRRHKKLFYCSPRDDKLDSYTVRSAQRFWVITAKPTLPEPALNSR